MTLRTLHLWLTSILVGILLGFFGAAAAHYFMIGIYFIEQVLNDYFKNSTSFIFLFCSLSITAVIVSLIKNDLLDEGVPAEQLDALLGGMLRVIHAVKKEGVDFQINPRIESYFMDRLHLTRKQTQYVIDESVKIAEQDQ